MNRMIAIFFSLCLTTFTLAGAPEIKTEIVNARGREKLGLILQFLQSSKQDIYKEKTGQLPDDYAQEALVLSRQFHDRHAEGIAQKYVAYNNFLQQQYEPALEGYFQSRCIFRELKDLDEEAAVNKEIGNLFSVVFFVFSDYGRAGEYYKNSLAWNRLNKNQDGIRKSINGMADVYRCQGQYQQAIPLYLEAFRLNEKANILAAVDDILCNLSDVYLKSGNFAESAKNIQLALVFNRKKRKSQAEGQLYSKKGFFFMRQNDFSGAYDYFRQALEIHQKFSGTVRIANELHNLGLLYSHFQHDGQAQEYFQKELALRQQRSDQIEIIETILAQALWLQKQDKLPQAEALLMFCESKAKQKRLQEKLAETYQRLASLYNLLHDQVKALYYQSLGKKILDGSPSVTILAGIQQLVSKNESSKEIDRLKMQKRRQIIISVLAICLLLTMIGLLAGKQKSIKRWARNHLLIKDRQLQEKKAQLLDMQHKLGKLQEKQSRSKYNTSHLSTDRGKEYLQLVLQHMQQDKLFLDGELTLKKMAAKVGANTSYLSQVINENLGMGFNDFVNHFRIEEAKKIMSTDDKNEWDVIDICFEVGFNSLSSFYRIFKVHTRMTPVEFQLSCRKKTDATA